MVMLLSVNLSAKKTQNIYESNCVSCHKKLAVSIDKFFYRYLLKYSSQTQVKTKIFNYLKTPSKEETVMVESFIKKYGIKNPSTLDDDLLKKAIDIYWDKYKIFGKLK